ncbi:hypothetical protein PC128_g5501 [Phytophthora cactorum]|nr:hypothetical protein PC128_g5501 [Phytophthora cactorum]
MYTTYPLAFAAITGGQVTVDAVGNTTSTTVTGPQDGTPLKAMEIDMETMTDAFMTAITLAAVAGGTTKITGIANQRVQECNRIEVMVTELRKIGVACGEPSNGIWIKGTASKTEHLKKASIACHNEHRIAMSFAVLGSMVDNVIITDKTYPEFWDHVQMHLGLPVAPVIEEKINNTDAATPIPGVYAWRRQHINDISKGTNALELCTTESRRVEAVLH